MTVEEMRELEDLLARVPGNEVYDFEQAHGMLTAILVGPVPVMPRQWLPYIFSSTGEMPEFESQEQVEQLLLLLIKLNNHIASQLERLDFRLPATCANHGEGRKINMEPWCESFFQGVEFWGPQWLEREDDGPEIDFYLYPIAYFTHPECEKKRMMSEKSAEQIAQIEERFISQIPLCVCNIGQRWREYIYERGGGERIDRPEKSVKACIRIRQAALCLCGSGLHYSICCGPSSNN
jgi:yecA family protein